MKIKQYLFLLIASIIIFVGCEEQLTPADNQGTDPGSGRSFIPGLGDSVNLAGIIGFINIGHYNGYIDGLGGYGISENIAASFFKMNHGFTIDAGFLIVNSDTVDRNSHDMGNGNTGYSYGSLYDVVFNETTYQCVLTGSSDFPNMNISVDAPNTDVVVSSPYNGQVIDKDSALTVLWGGTYDVDNNVQICIHPGITIYCDDTGSFTIPDSVMSGLSTGNVNIRVFRGRAAYKEVPGVTGKFLVAVVQSSYSMECVLQ